MRSRAWRTSKPPRSVTSVPRSSRLFGSPPPLPTATGRAWFGSEASIRSTSWANSASREGRWWRIGLSSEPTYGWSMRYWASRSSYRCFQSTRVRLLTDDQPPFVPAATCRGGRSGPASRPPAPIPGPRRTTRTRSPGRSPHEPPPPSEQFCEPLRPRLRNVPMHVAMRRPAILSRHQFGMPATDDLPPRLARMVLVPPPAEIVSRRTGRFRQLRPIGRVGVAAHTVTCAADQPRRGGCVSGPIRFAVHHPVVESGEHFHGVEPVEFAGDTVGGGPRVRWGEVGVDRFDQLDELILSHRASPPELPQQKGDDDDRPDGEEQDRFPIERVGAAVVVPV